MFPGAGGNRPADAVGASSVVEDTALLRTPSGNIICELGATGGGCGVMSYLETAPYGSDDIGDPKWWIWFSTSGEPTIGSKSDATLADLSGVQRQEVPYGSAVHHGEMVCGSDQNGLTCWNTRTGHGAHMNKQGYRAF